jgi:1-acyl-sn-glycerol-3-phosphate acyltransferase
MHFLARDTLFRPSWFGALLRKLHTHPLHRGTADRGALRLAAGIAASGSCLLVFPEGTRTSTGEFGALRGGAALIAKEAGVPVIPTLVDGAYEAWPRHRAFPVPRPVRVVFGPPIAPDPDPRKLTAQILDGWKRCKTFLGSIP